MSITDRDEFTAILGNDIRLGLPLQAIVRLVLLAGVWCWNAR
jgi:hypothetical protein